MAIIGVDRVGVSLAEELLSNVKTSYVPRCFIDINKEKVGRCIHDIPVWSENEVILKKLEEFGVQEIIFAISTMNPNKKEVFYNYYKDAEYKLKVYDYPIMYNVDRKRYL